MFAQERDLFATAQYLRLTRRMTNCRLLETITFSQLHPEAFTLLMVVSLVLKMAAAYERCREPPRSQGITIYSVREVHVEVFYFRVVIAMYRNVLGSVMYRGQGTFDQK
jgi:hypothetical protein